MDLGLNGKVALVTGAGSGIGQAIALMLAAEGAKVAATDMNLAAATETAEMAKADGGEAMALPLNVTSLGEAKKAVADTLEAYGGLDVLVNSAGAWRINMFVDSNPDDWDFEIDVCLKGTINCTRAALDAMIAKGGSGKIVSVASDAGRVGEFRQPVYSGAKAGIIGFSKAVAKEVGKHGIHLNCVCPGYTKTPGVGDMPEEQEARIAKVYPLRKLGLPDDVAKVVVFMASDGASHMTGQTVSVSGGYTMV